MNATASADYEHTVHIDGVNAFIPTVKNEGQQITISGWTRDHYRYNEGDRILIINGDQQTRYRITSIRRPGDPPDMYFLECQFDPRPAPQPVEA